jgi:hypothetical protein
MSDSLHPELDGYKSCPDCSQIKPFSQFPRNVRRSDGFGLYCKACFAIRYRKHRERKAEAAGRTVRSRRLVPAGHKFCPACQQMLPKNRFANNRASRDGLTAYCKPCHNAKGKATYTRLYGSTREYHLRRRYGIGQADVERMLAEQDNTCAGCDQSDPGNVDHDHATGVVRGMLCFNCNQALGNVRDSVSVLRALQAYLTRHRLNALEVTITESRVEGCLIEVLGQHRPG